MPDQERIYIGNVVLDESNQEMLRQWLLDIINSLQGHGNGFDADTVDGFHATDFATYEQGLKADNALQSGILIGSSAIYNVAESQYIKTDGVKIDDIVYNNLIEYISNLTDDMLLSDFLVALYENYDDRIKELDERKVNKIPGKGLSTEDFTTSHKQIVEEIALAYDEVLCPKDTNPSQQTVRRVLNAGTVNHLQFILTTETLYAQYTDEVKNAWNNVFIFIEEEFYPDDYESPLDCPIETGYVFHIDDDNEERPGEIWLQYRGKNAANWVDMVKINDLYSQFLKYGNFENIMKEIARTIVNNTVEELNTPENLNSLITRISPPGSDDWNSYPFWSREVDFVFDVVYDGRSLCSPNEDGFLIADVSNVTTQIEGEVEALDNKIGLLSNAVNTINNTYLKKSDVLSSLTDSSLPASASAVQSVTSTLVSQCENIQGDVRTIKNDISTIKQTLNFMKYFQKYIVLGIGKYDGKYKTEFRTPTDQHQDTLDSYLDVQAASGVLQQVEFSVTNIGHITLNTPYSNPDFIYARLIQEHTGEPAAYDYPRWMFFQVNGVLYAREIKANEDYAILNINLPPGNYIITAMYIDESGSYQHPICMTQELIVKEVYGRKQTGEFYRLP